MDGAMIGQYRVTGVIGRGGMGAVYAGEHALLGRPAAIKILLPELSQKQDLVARFFNEARAATAIRHPSIVEIYDFGWTPEGAAFIVMERLEGETLQKRAARSRFRWPGVLAIARQIAGALSAAHAKGIVHRDLKPDNVFLVPDPEVPGGERIKLLDFGIAKLAVDTTTTISVTKTGAVMGTPTYMAPEQCRGVAVDHRADLYALGCVIYELCCGRPPFRGEGSGDVLAAHIHVPVPPMSGAISEIPPAVEKLVRRLLAKSPADRLQSADDLIRAIDALAPDRVLGSTGPRPAIAAPTVPTVTTLSGSASTSMLLPGARRRSRIRLLALAAGLAALAAAIVVVAMGGSAPRATRSTEPAASGATPPQVMPSTPTARPPAAEPAPSRAPVALDQTSPGAPAPSSTAQVPIASPPREPPPSSATQDRTAANADPPDPAGATEPAAAARPTPEPSPSPPAVEAPRARPPAAPADPAASTAAEPLPATIDVAVDSSPSGAQIVVDGAVVGTTPFHGTLPRQDRDVKLVLRLAGYLERSIVARASRPISERVKLVRPPPPPPRSPRSSRDQSYNPF